MDFLFDTNFSNLHEFLILDFSQNAQNIARGFNHGKRHGLDVIIYCVLHRLKRQAMFEIEVEQKINSWKLEKFVANKNNLCKSF